LTSTSTPASDGNCLDRLVAGIDRRGGEDRALAGGSQHARADRHDVRRLVARARALHDRDLAGIGPLALDHLEFGLKSSRSGLAACTPDMNSGTKSAGSLTNFFMASLLSGKLKRLAVALRELGRDGRRVNTVLLAPVLQDRGNRHDAGIGGVGAALADLAGAAAMGHQLAGLVDRLVGDAWPRRRARREVAAVGMLLQRLVDRDQRVEQGLVAALGAAAGHDAFDRRSEHVGQVAGGIRSCPGSAMPPS
jgi:hypothetical protein